MMALSPRPANSRPLTGRRRTRPGFLAMMVCDVEVLTKNGPRWRRAESLEEWEWCAATGDERKAAFAPPHPPIMTLDDGRKMMLRVSARTFGRERVYDAIRDRFGDRCDHFDPECQTCQAWLWFDFASGDCTE